MGMELQNTQVVVFLALTALIAAVTYWYCRGARSGPDGEQEYFLAGGSLKWYFVAGSITLTNLSTDQLVGMNGNQMALLAWWELAAVVGLMMLCFVFIPVYYKFNCTTTTELLERRFNNPHIRALISVLFLLGNIFIFLPAILYGGSQFMISMFGLPETKSVIPFMGEINPYILYISVAFAIIGAAYAIFGGLRAVAVSDTFSGFLILGLAGLVTFLALKAINFDFSGVPMERLTLIGAPDSDIPFATLFTGMLFIQMFYWSTNQTITQRAMASPSVKEAQKGIFAAAIIRLLIIPPIIVIPGIVAYKLYGRVENDLAYGQIVGDILPTFLSGAFAAAIAAAILTTFNSILNASAALWVCDIHETYIDKQPKVRKLSFWVSVVMVALGLIMVPFFATQESLINTVQKFYGLLSMPILSAFIVGLLFKNVNAYAMIMAVIFGVVLYYIFISIWPVLPGGGYIHMMAVTLISSVAVALLINRVVFGQKAQWDAHSVFGKGQVETGAQKSV
jgi:SSS family solute:Na+ symporter